MTRIHVGIETNIGTKFAMTMFVCLLKIQQFFNFIPNAAQRIISTHKKAVTYKWFNLIIQMQPTSNK